jgi:hypothetical protein
MFLPIGLAIYVIAVIVVEHYPGAEIVVPHESEILDPISLKLWQFNMIMNSQNADRDKLENLLKSLSILLPGWSLVEIYPNSSLHHELLHYHNIPFRCYGNDIALRMKAAEKLAART